MSWALAWSVRTWHSCLTLQALFGIGKNLVGGGGKAAVEKTRATKTSPADVVSWSGCKDSQTSADTQGT